MQTFLPYESYTKSAQHLDNKRLGKQRVECKQLLLALGVPIGEHVPGKSGWKNHPATRMWRGYENALLVYSFSMCMEWQLRGYKDNLGDEFVRAYAIRAYGEPEERTAPRPPWASMPEVYASHRSNLLRKDKDFYGKFGWTEPDDLPYVWPV
jgi:hypothetical protein